MRFLKLGTFTTIKSIKEKAYWLRDMNKQSNPGPKSKIETLKSNKSQRKTKIMLKFLKSK